MDEVMSPQSDHVIKGKGMPILDANPLAPLQKSYKRGNLIVKFNIMFPEHLSTQQKDDITAILDEEWIIIIIN